MLVLFLVSVLAPGCGLGPSAEAKYESSFLKIWNQLTSKEKNLEQEADKKQDNIDELINVYKKGLKNHQEARRQLKRLSPPAKFKKLHNLTLVFLDGGIKYFSEITRIAQETKGNYTEEQAETLRKLQNKWEAASKTVLKEAKKQGWEVR